MPGTPMPRILHLGDPPSNEIHHLFADVGFPIVSIEFARTNAAELSGSQLILLEVPGRLTNMVQGLCRRWRIEFGEQFIPIMWLTLEDNPSMMEAALESGADICFSNRVPLSVLLAQAKSLLRIQHMNSRLHIRSSEAQQINQRLQQAYQQMDNDLELTRRIHRGFLPRSLPEIMQTRFAVCYRPRSRIGGDFYDVIRLDEENVGFYVADAMGKGLPASSLLSIYVKRSLVPKEIIGRSYRLVPPNEILGKLNRDLVALNLPEPPFVTMLWMQLNCRDGAISFARAAHPHPVYIPSDGEVVYWHSPGTLLGVFDSTFPTQTKQLRSRDKVLLFSDGVQPSGNGGSGTSNDLLLDSARRHRHFDIQTFIDEITRDMLEHSKQQEDFTLLGLEFR